MRWNKKSKIWKCYGIYNIRETYCVASNKNTANKNFSDRKTEQNRLMLVSEVWRKST